MAAWIPIPPSPPATPAPRCCRVKELRKALMPHFSSDPTATPPIFPNLEKSPQIVTPKVAETKERKQKRRRRRRLKQPSAPESRENRSGYPWGWDRILLFWYQTQVPGACATVGVDQCQGSIISCCSDYRSLSAPPPPPLTPPRPHLTTLHEGWQEPTGCRNEPSKHGDKA